jgi:hypothetical protein
MNGMKLKNTPGVHRSDFNMPAMRRKPPVAICRQDLRGEIGSTDARSKLYSVTEYFLNCPFYGEREILPFFSRFPDFNPKLRPIKSIFTPLNSRQYRIQIIETP